MPPISGDTGAPTTPARTERAPGQPEQAPSQAERAALIARRMPRPAGPRFVAVGSYQAPAGRHAAPHHYAVWKVGYYLSGEITATVDGTRYLITPGSILIVPPRAAHAEQASTAYSNIFVLVHAPDRWPWPTIVPPGDLPDVGRLFGALLAESGVHDRFSEELMNALISQLDVLLRRRCAVGSRAAEVVAAAEQLMYEGYSTGVSITDIAARLAVSGSTLRAYFAAERGCSPQERLRDIRLQNAESLLHTSDLTVETVAIRCGFHSASHLGRHLRAAHGVPPSALRDRALRDGGPSSR